MSEHNQSKPVHHPRIASRIYSGEVVIINPDLNRVQLLNTVGSRIWELADGSRSVNEIITILTEEYDVEEEQARQSVTIFLQGLEEKGLILWR